jgi:hypothetical protein
MKNNLIARRKVVSLIWPVAFLGSGGGAGIWLGFAQDSVLLASVVLTLTALLGIVWLSRIRAARRWNAAVEAYAERELAREQRRKLRRVAS